MKRSKVWNAPRKTLKTLRIKDNCQRQGGFMRHSVKSLVIFLTLAGCAHTPGKPPAPPANTQEACEQIRDFFSSGGAQSALLGDMSKSCQLRLTGETQMSGRFKKFLQQRGWQRDAAFEKATPNSYAWDTPSTRCVVEELPNHAAGGDPRGSIGIGGGSSGGFFGGVGIGVGGSSNVYLDFKIDCTAKKAD